MVLRTRGRGFGDDRGGVVPDEIRRRRAFLGAGGIRLCADPLRRYGEFHGDDRRDGRRAGDVLPPDGARCRDVVPDLRLCGHGERRPDAEQAGRRQNGGEPGAAGRPEVRGAGVFAGDGLFGDCLLHVRIYGRQGGVRGLFPLRDDLGRRAARGGRDRTRRQERPAYGPERFDGVQIPVCVVVGGTTFGSTVGTFATSAAGGGDGRTKYAGWAELPVEADNGDYHYAYHICPDFKVDGHEARNFTVCYSAEHHSPVWVAAPVHNCYVGSSGNRNYGPDPVIPSSIQPSGSKASMGSPYNRGHMLGNYERSRTSGMNKQVSYYTNIAAQHGSTFNTGDGAWNNLEDKIDDYWCADTLYVVVGAYYDKWTDSYGNSAPQRSTSFGNITTDVPTMFYTLCLRTKKGNTNKSVLNCAADELQCAAFVMSHAMGKGHDPQAGDMRSVKEIEELTGFTFFANVPNAPKDTYNASDWGL
ncbi:DNA/RNA non-specific endonuclease [Alistipes sp. CAG:29]|uniref:DNA/RNA non-specific endonuclease n=1 Tax=Alistipes sp. CAG:29 TaxID=1262694 RepID=UPI0025841527|nr:DNA/RNA non-specific endonuclease [Alistipes sp. CAG:29]